MEKKEVKVFGEKLVIDPPHKEDCNCILCQEEQEGNKSDDHV